MCMLLWCIYEVYDRFVRDNEGADYYISKKIGSV